MINVGEKHLYLSLYYSIGLGTDYIGALGLKRQRRSPPRQVLLPEYEGPAQRHCGEPHARLEYDDLFHLDLSHTHHSS
jgi:hypothetical protein